MKICLRRLDSKVKRSLLNDYIKNERRLLLLDYDGTLIPFADIPEKAEPDEALLETLESLTEEGSEVVIVSGRDKCFLEKWFGGMSLGLIAEHGAWIKEKGSGWRLSESLRNDWKKSIFPILESYVKLTPGSFIEEKDFSLVWHYRKANTEIGVVRAMKLKDDLFHLASRLNLEVLEGDKVIEVRNAAVNKGRAALHWISKEDWNFILAIGDDIADEDLFSVLPESAYSIKVRLAPSQAKFFVESVDDVRSLLKEIISVSRTREARRLKLVKGFL